MPTMYDYEVAIYYDSSRCTNCKGCQIACKCWNNLPSPIGKNENPFTNSYQNPEDLNGDTRLVQRFAEYDAPEGWPKPVQWAFTRRSCKHCTEAGCVDVCPTGALTHDEVTGFVRVEDEKCIGCHYCHMACPFDVPHYFGGRAVINKCTGCLDRVEHGMKPACVTTCQPEALDFGARDEMLKKAHARVAELKKRGFTDAVVYGEHEMGGLHVISVLKYGTEKHGEVENPQLNPLAPLFKYVAPVSGVAAAVTVAGLAFTFVTGLGFRYKNMRYNPKTGDVIDVDTGKLVRHVDPMEVAEESKKWHLKQVSTRHLRKSADTDYVAVDADGNELAAEGDGDAAGKPADRAAGRAAGDETAKGGE